MTIQEAVGLAASCSMGTGILGIKILWEQEDLSQKVWKVLGVATCAGLLVFGFAYAFAVK